RMKASRGGGRSERVTTANPTKSTEVTIRTTTKGHSPLSSGERSSATKKTEMKIPAPVDNHTTRAVTGCGASSWTWLTMTTATMPTTMPSQATMGSRSPNNTPADTGRTTATTADTGEATLIGPIASAGNSVAYAAAPASPESKPHPMAA